MFTKLFSSNIASPWSGVGLSLRSILLTILIAFALAIILYKMGRNPFCTCGFVKFWHGEINSSQDSQHFLDWYSFTHILHGIFFYGGLWSLKRFTKLPISLGLALVIAVIAESSWELIENSNVVIERYRAITISLGYFGDSIFNSLSDLLMMLIGFFMARKLPLLIIITFIIFVEFWLLLEIKDNLTLNIIMLLWPQDFIRNWQMGS